MTAEGLLLNEDVSNYDDSKHKKPSVTVDIVICTIKDDDLKVLLIKRKYPPFRDHLAIPGGFVDVESLETLEQTALRELKEETNLENIYIEQLYTYGDPHRDPRKRIITVAYFALVPYSKLNEQEIIAKDDAKEVSWLSLKNIDDISLAFDHNKILKDVLSRIQGKLWYSNIGFELAGKRFTWKQLQNVFEIILDKKMVVSNFRRKIRSLCMIEDLLSTSASKGRPARYLIFEGIK